MANPRRALATPHGALAPAKLTQSGAEAGPLQPKHSRAVSRRLLLPALRWSEFHHPISSIPSKDLPAWWHETANRGCRTSQVAGSCAQTVGWASKSSSNPALPSKAAVALRSYGAARTWAASRRTAELTSRSRQQGVPENKPAVSRPQRGTPADDSEPDVARASAKAAVKRTGAMGPTDKGAAAEDIAARVVRGLCC